MQMTADVLVKACRDNGGYRQPRLNDQLFLQCRGFCEIAHLDEYTELKALWLDQNAIQEIEGLEKLQKLASLFLQGNTIRTIAGLNTCANLRTLNLSNNYITKVTGLSGCPLLETLQLAHNRIERLDDMTEIWALENLSSFDVSHNRLDEKPEGVEDDMFIAKFFSKCPALTVLYLHGQELPRKFKHYRKNMIVGLPQLTYLDERPIFPQERRTAEAWASGGAEAEKAELGRIRQEKVDELTACLRNQERMKDANKEIKAQREREWAEREAREKEWRAQLKLETTAKCTELDHAEYEARAHLAQAEEDAFGSLSRACAAAREAAIDAEHARLAAEAAARKAREVQEQAERELAEREAQLRADRERERAKRQEKFDEMRYWVKKFAEEDDAEEEQRQREVEELLDMLQAPYVATTAHAMPSEGPSTSGNSAQENISATHSDPNHSDRSDTASNASESTRRKRGAADGGKKSKAVAKRWAASAARFEQFYKMEVQRKPGGPAPAGQS